MVDREVKFPGFKVVYNPVGDGNCFYHAVAYALAWEIDGQRVKEEVINYLQGLSDEDSLWESLYAEFKGSTRKQIIARLEQEWADHVTIQACADVYGRSLEIISADGQRRPIEPRTESRGTVCLGYTGNHYLNLEKECTNSGSSKPRGQLVDIKDLKETCLLPFKSISDRKMGAKAIQAEKAIYGMFEDKRIRKEPMYVVHSFNYHEEVQLVSEKGEIDFLVLHRDLGPIIVEIKSTDKRDDSIEEAKKQLNKHREVMRNVLRMCGDKDADNISLCRGLVVLPNLKKAVEERGSSQTAVLTGNNCDFKSFTSHLLKQGSPTYSCETLNHLLKWTRGQHLSPLAGKCGKGIWRLDQETKKLYDRTHQELKRVAKCETKRKWITGPAGSGKTWLLKMKVGLLANSIKCNGKKILVLCYNNSLSVYLKDIFKCSAQVSVMTYGKFLYDHLNLKVTDSKCKIREVIANHKSGVKKCRTEYQHIYVDEGQDLSGDWYDLLECFLDTQQGSDENYFWVNYDQNQNVQPGSNSSQRYQQQLQGSHKLTVVLRSTKSISDFFLRYYDSSDNLSPIKRGNLEGKKVDFILLSDGATVKISAKDVYHCIMNVSKQHSLHWDSICVLTTSRTSGKILGKELQREHNIPCQKSHIFPRKQAVIVDSISRFKGLESKVLILVFLGKDAPKDSILYTGISRACTHLTIITTTVIKKKITARQGKEI